MVWYLHIWLIHLALLYSHKGRAVSAVSGYLDSAFEEETLVQSVCAHIERVRGIGSEAGAPRHVFEILTTEHGQDVPRWVRAFLGLMVDSGLLVRSDSGVCEQTLLGAVEIARGFSRRLQHIMPDEDALQNIVNLGEFSRGGKSRGKEATEACDHDYESRVQVGDLWDS